jgi:hypothetical protein
MHVIWNREDWDQGVERAPLNSRAWVCQERFLSPSNIHFTSGKLFWECKELSACEILPNGYPESMRWTSHRTMQGLSNGFLGMPHEQWERDLPGQAWGKLLGKYTAAQLTFRRDKLVAFSGLAATWSKLHSDSYLAGLWKSRLPVELMWSVSCLQKDQDGSKEYISPSVSLIYKIMPIFFFIFHI